MGSQSPVVPFLATRAAPLPPSPSSHLLMCSMHEAGRLVGVAVDYCHAERIQNAGGVAARDIGAEPYLQPPHSSPATCGSAQGPP
jgi:hypothetical protein